MESMRMKPQANEIYRHFKGNLYKVMAIAIHSETEEEMVVYQALYGDYKIYVRPLESFMSPVDHVKYPDVEAKNRFELISAAVQVSATPAPVAATIEPATEAPAATASQLAEAPVAEPQPAEVAATVEPQVTAATAPQPAEAPVAEPAESVYELRPLVEEFLDADTVDERRRILAALRPTVTQDELTIMATVMDIELDEELELQERYRQLLICLDTKSKFETLRLR